MELVDTHCHIQSAGQHNGEKGTRELWAKAPGIKPSEIIDRAEKAGITKMVCVGCNLEDSELAISFAQDKPQCYASIGLHPHEAQDYADDDNALLKFSALAGRQKVVAVGECGLDYYYEHSPKSSQEKVLRFQIELALEHDLPVIFHVREAFDDFWPIYESYENVSGVLHSFTDSQENMERAVNHGLYIGVNGIATFAKNEAQQGMYRFIPLEKLVLETDAPYLTPIPYRGNICEPYHIRVIAEYLSGQKQVSVTSLAEASTNNARNLFGI